MDKFDEATKVELTQFMEQEQAKARLQSSVHQYTDMCWTKCITGSPSTRFSRGEESCLVNCVDRFLDASLFIVNKLQSQRDASANTH